MAASHGPTSWLLSVPGLSHDPELLYVNAGIFLTTGICAFSLLAYQFIKGKQAQYIVPEAKFSVVNITDIIIEGVYNMIAGTLGAEATKKHFPFIASLFLFVLLSNLMGLIPFAASPTASISTNLALGFSSFIYYNAYGIQAHGFVGYLKHFLMGLGPLGVMVAFFELISHALRPVTLALRLFLNLYIDHTVVHTFQSLLAWFLPVPLLLFGIVVCTIQAFVFATLSSVYVQLATEHEEEHGHDHH